MYLKSKIMKIYLFRLVMFRTNNTVLFQYFAVLRNVYLKKYSARYCSCLNQLSEETNSSSFLNW